MAKNIPFPVNTATACIQKWNWSSIFLTTGKVACCHRNKKIKIPKEDFDNFHNLPYYLDHRQSMLAGKWPNSPDHLGCRYCKLIEDAGGISDRIELSKTAQDWVPDELENDPSEINVTPTVLEVYLSNYCNMSCTYCDVNSSSKILAEVKKYPQMQEFNRYYLGEPEQHLSKAEQNEYKKLLLDWLSRRGHMLKRFHLLGGEPFTHYDFDDFLLIWRTNPNPNLIFNVISNMNISHSLWKSRVDVANSMVENNNIGNFEITASIDSWGPKQEYARTGFNSSLIEKNVLYYLNLPTTKTMNINSTYSILNITEYKQLVKKKKQWEEITGKKIRLRGSIVGSKFLSLGMLGGKFLEPYVKEILKEYQTKTADEQSELRIFIGLIKQASVGEIDLDRIHKFVEYYDEIDRRRKTNWRETFPEIASEIEKHIK